MQLLIIFIVASIINVVIQTVKSIVTIKCGKWSSALVNAVAYGFYTWIVVLTVCDLDLWTKMIITAITNFIGVWIVKHIEEKARKDKLWKIEATVEKPYTTSLHHNLNSNHIPHNYIENIGKYSIFNVYCENQAQSKVAKALLNGHKAKYFVSESKVL